MASRPAGGMAPREDVPPLLPVAPGAEGAPSGSTGPIALGDVGSPRKFAVQFSREDLPRFGPVIHVELTEWGELREDVYVDRHQVEVLLGWLGAWLVDTSPPVVAGEVLIANGLGVPTANTERNVDAMRDVTPRPIPTGITQPRPGYTYAGANPCTGRTCSALIHWWITPNGKRSPHDEDGTSHFATCPDSARFRSK